MLHMSGWEWQRQAESAGVKHFPCQTRQIPLLQKIQQKKSQRGNGSEREIRREREATSPGIVGVRALL